MTRLGGTIAKAQCINMGRFFRTGSYSQSMLNNITHSESKKVQTKMSSSSERSGKLTQQDSDLGHWCPLWSRIRKDVGNNEERPSLTNLLTVNRDKFALRMRCELLISLVLKCFEHSSCRCIAEPEKKEEDLHQFCAVGDHVLLETREEVTTCFLSQGEEQVNAARTLFEKRLKKQDSQKIFGMGQFLRTRTAMQC